MRRLILLRHAKTERDAPSGRDIDRRLDARGEDDAAQMGRWLSKNNYRPDLALVSPAARARQTWTILARSLSGTATDESPALYGADARELLAIIREARASANSVMVVAHNPGLQELALALIAQGDRGPRDALASNLPTTGVAIIDFDITEWSDVAPRAGRLELYISPKILKEETDNG